MWTWRDLRLEISPGFLLLLAALLYLDDGVGLLVWGLLACVIHEAGHIVGAWVLKGRPRRLTLSIVGAELDFYYAKPLSYVQDILVILAGPLANLLFGLIAYSLNAYIPAIFSFGIGGFNLLPILPLDGGQVLCRLLGLWLDPPWPDRILAGFAGVQAGVLSGLGVIAAVNYANMTLVFTALWLLIGILRN